MKGRLWLQGMFAGSDRDELTLLRCCKHLYGYTAVTCRRLLVCLLCRSRGMHPCHNLLYCVLLLHALQLII